MKFSSLDSTFLKSIIARRMFFLFVGCAMVPLVVVTVLTFFQVTRQIKSQSLDRLQQSSKIHGMSIYERFLSMESDLQLIAAAMVQNKGGTSSLASVEPFFHERLRQRYQVLYLLLEGGDPQVLFGDVPFNFELNQELFPGKGKSKILVKKQKNAAAQVYLVVSADTPSLQQSLVIAQVNTIYLWGIGYENILPPMTELCILDSGREVLVSSFSTTPKLMQEIAFRAGGAGVRQFEYSEAGTGDFLLSFWPLYLKGRFDAPNLTVILRQAKRDVLAPLQDFKTIFPLVVLLSLWIVLLLSMVFIRRYMVPVEKLNEATKHIAQRDFSHVVDVRSGDEFETLAQSFNAMSQRLNTQFNTLGNISDISQAILSSLDRNEIIETALLRLSHFMHSDAGQLILFKDEKANIAVAYSYSAVSMMASEEEILEITHAEKNQLLEKQFSLCAHQEEQPRYLKSLFTDTMPVVLQLPLVSNKELKGMVNLAFKADKVLSDDDCSHARQLVDQVTIALENAGLIDTLKKLNWGILQALARTVDAKSPWTAGHSERVTELAIKIAKIMGCTEKAITTLHQAALVHDIGKIGIANVILDKPAKLTDQEFDHVKEHPAIGARILEPVSVFADAINIVLHHHERWDGSGYPFGLKGDGICLGARILAVADVYDALVSQRPYRDGWLLDKVLEHIDEGSGTKFDAEVVKAFKFAIQ